MYNNAKQGFSISENRIPLGLPAYKKISNSSHEFETDRLYSFHDIARLTGLSPVGVRQRAILDQWPTAPIWVHSSRIRRPQYVSGEFLRDIQLKVGGQDNA